MSTSNPQAEKIQLNMALPGRLGHGIKRLIEAGEFATQAEYVRHLIQNDLPNRLAQIEQDEIIRHRLAQVEQGAPLIPYEEAVRYFTALMRGEKPDRPKPITP
jgi:Arc/MetJ-type ribon-helix-helix transcriptional regulator